MIFFFVYDINSAEEIITCLAYCKCERNTPGVRPNGVAGSLQVWSQLGCARLEPVHHAARIPLTRNHLFCECDTVGPPKFFARKIFLVYIAHENPST